MGDQPPSGHDLECRIPNFTESASGRKSELVDIWDVFAPMKAWRRGGGILPPH